MIDIINVTKSFGGEDIIKNASLRINRDERAGVVGPNGSGKTTLFSLITGEILPDSGSALLPSNIRTGYLRQHLSDYGLESNIVDFTADAVEGLAETHNRIVELEKKLAESPGESALRELGRLQTRYEALGAYSMRNRAEAALTGLGFKPADLARPLGSFSGGWRMRAALARTLIAAPDILLLDEPSNYLDLPAVEWLKRFLSAFDGTMLLISHDRYLLRSLTSVTVEVNAGVITRYQGNYDYYMEERARRAGIAAAAKKNQDKKKDRLQKNIDRFRAKSSKASQVQSWIKSLDRMDDVQEMEDLHFSGNIIIPDAPHSGLKIAALEDAGHSYDGGASWIFRDVSLSINRGDKIGVVGYNGAGKSTLLRILAGRMPPAAGKRELGHQVVVGYQAQEFGEILPPDLTPAEIVRAAAPPDALPSALRRMLGIFGFSGDDVHKKTAVLSGGEKIRLCFARIFASPPNFLILDEPTTHLDIAAREALQEAILEYDGAVCLVSHDVEFIRNSVTSIIAMEDGGVSCYCGNYDYYREKLAQKQRGTEAESPDSQSAPGKGSGVMKERRRERAAARGELGKIKKKAGSKVSGIETELSSLDAEKHALSNVLIENKPGTDYASVSRRLKEIETRTLSLITEWETASAELEDITRLYEEAHSSN